MVGHESVDPKPQEKSDLVYWRDSFLSGVCEYIFYICTHTLQQNIIRGAAWLRRKGIRS